ncbi:hypothetical protein [Azospirillum sp. SYSU D00513]|uniref:hypothetical protein n=1 Tax=Azospirillum sp. SYSU D00513 TaxID=2812561 RepID=UPI001A96BB82|nr:hypothetical protein [Azospirillum sp. SYSU D00513]
MKSLFGGEKPNRGLGTILGLLVAGTLLGTAAPAAADHRDRGWGHERGWDRDRDWDRRGHRDRWERGPRHHHHYPRPRPPAVIYAPPPVYYAPPPVVYAPRPYYHAPRPGFSFQLNIP